MDSTTPCAGVTEPATSPMPPSHSSADALLPQSGSLTAISLELEAGEWAALNQELQQELEEGRAGRLAGSTYTAVPPPLAEVRRQSVCGHLCLL